MHAGTDRPQAGAITLDFSTANACGSDGHSSVQTDRLRVGKGPCHSISGLVFTDGVANPAGERSDCVVASKERLLDASGTAVYIRLCG
jgi:hypothetical protein